MADGVGAAEVLARERFIDDGDRRCADTIVGRDGASP